MDDQEDDLGVAEVIVQYLEQIAAGITVDRAALIDAHRERASELRSFFGLHDHMMDAAGRSPSTLARVTIPQPMAARIFRTRSPDVRESLATTWCSKRSVAAVWASFSERTIKGWSGRWP